MAKQTHLTLVERCTIESMLNNSESFKAIGRKLGRHCTTISKEVRGHILFKKTGCFGHPFNDCANRRHCDYTNLCSSPKCRSKSCRNCSNCHLHCPDYFKEYCKKLSTPPYVCNGCSERMKCTLEKHIYSAVSSIISPVWTPQTVILFPSMVNVIRIFLARDSSCCFKNTPL